MSAREAASVSAERSAFTPADGQPHFACPRCQAAIDWRLGQGARCPSCGASYPERDGILELVIGSRGAPGYDPHYFSTLPAVEDRHFWYVGRRHVVLDALRRSVPDLGARPLLDLGCGSGHLLAFLARSGVRVAGACDAYPQGVRLARTRLSAPLAVVDEGRLPPLAAGQSMVSMFDVLEHIDDDRGTLAWLRSRLAPGGVLALTVPAHPFLFDEMDVLACHRRRYRRAELREKLESAGFEVRRLTHFMAPMVPLLLAVRWAGRTFHPARDDAAARRAAELRVQAGVNEVFRGLLALERLWLRALPLPFGSSLVAVAARPASPA